MMELAREIAYKSPLKDFFSESFARMFCRLGHASSIARQLVNSGAGGGSFVTQGDAPERDSAFFDVGVDAGVSSNVTLFLDYQAQAGEAHFFAQSAQGGLRIGF